MTSIKAACPVDGEVELTSDDVALRICQQRQPLSRYEFICPVCSEMVAKPADEHIQALLISAGVAVELLDIPLEAFEEHNGAPIAYDDILDFHLALQTTDLLAPYAGA